LARTEAFFRHQKFGDTKRWVLTLENSDTTTKKKTVQPRKAVPFQQNSIEKVMMNRGMQWGSRSLEDPMLVTGAPSKKRV
jgi:hypothetical protein